jgi:hypothetical protein
MPDFLIVAVSKERLSAGFKGVWHPRGKSFCLVILAQCLPCANYCKIQQLSGHSCPEEWLTRARIAALNRLWVLLKRTKAIKGHSARALTLTLIKK